MLTVCLCPFDSKTRGLHDLTSLMAAASNGHLEVVEWLLEAAVPGGNSATKTNDLG